MVSDWQLAQILYHLSAAFAATTGDIQRLTLAGQRVLGKRWRWLRPLAQRLAQSISFEPSSRSTPQFQKLIREFLKEDRAFQRACTDAAVFAQFRISQAAKTRTRAASLYDVSRALANALTRSRWNEQDLVAAAARVVGGEKPWLRNLIDRLLLQLGSGRRPAPSKVMAFLMDDVGLAKQCRKKGVSLRLVLHRSAAMSPARGNPATWKVPQITSTAELAEWLNLKLEQLEWMADRKHLERHEIAGRLRNYRYFWLAKRIGGTARLIEAPKWKLKRIQQQILHEILDRIPPHPAAHGYCLGRSVVSYVEQHTGQDVVIRLDLKDFFPSIHRSQVAAIFQCAGYPYEVSQSLAALCTNSVPADVWTTFPQYGVPFDRFQHEMLYCRPHLPQGAPTSPSLANLCCFRLDKRLANLASAAQATYTRYADDLLFSGGRQLSRSSRRFSYLVCAIAQEEGFQINTRKLRIMRSGARQQAAGIVLNERLNIPRQEYEKLKALLHNCIRFGAQSQNHSNVSDFRAHLHGRIGYIEAIHPRRGARLRALFQQIQWTI